MSLNILSTEFPARYGGNIRVFIGNIPINNISSGNSIEDILKQEDQFEDQLIAMHASMQKWKDAKNKEISDLVSKFGPLKGKAFPGRAAIFIKLLGLDETSIDCVYEKPGSMKIGHYLPGTRIPIKSDDELFALSESPPVIINMAWHISAEIHGFLKNKGFKGEIIDIYDPDWI
jgi:hypothetical protein